MELELLSFLTDVTLKEGIFAVLFVALLIYQLRETKSLLTKAEQREDKLTAFLADMKEQFAGLTKQYEKLSNDVAEVKNKITEKLENK